MATAAPAIRQFRPLRVYVTLVLLAIGFASIAWTRLSIAIILPEVMKGIGVASLAVGGLISTFTVLGTGIAEPFMGRLADVLGRRFMLILGLALFSLFSLLTGLVSNVPEMATVRILLGVAQGMFIPCYVAFVGSAFPSRRGIAVAILVGAFTVGNAIDPLFTRAVFGWTGAWQAPFIIYGLFGLLLAALLFPLGSGGLYEVGRKRKADVTDEDEALAVQQGKTGIFGRGMVLLMVTMTAWGLTQYGYLGLFVTFLRTQQHFSLGDAAAVLSIAGWCSFGSSFLMGWLSDHIGRRNTMLISGSLGLVFSYPLFTLTGSFWPAVIIAIVFQSCNGHFYPMGLAYAQDMARAHTLGGHTGAVSGIGHIMAGVAGLVAGSIAGSMGFLAVGWEFVALSAVMLLCIYLTVDPVHATRLAERRAAARMAIAEA